MFEIFVRSHFSSAHYLRDYPGKCEHLHGHNWNVEVAVAADTLNEIDVGIDFRDLKGIVNGILDGLDHTNLNEHPAFKETNPSSESIARYIYDQVAMELERSFPGVRPLRVTVCETPSSGVTYRPSM